jgi:DNA polymerase
VEDAIGKPFVGPSGNLANSWLRDAGIDPDECAWLNVVSCFPNRTPTKGEVEACAENVDEQLQVIQPQWIIMFGGVAVGRWWPGIRMGDIRGKFWQIDISGNEQRNSYKAWVMATWHPAAVLRNTRLATEVADDLRRFRRVVTLKGRDPLAIDRGQVSFPFNYTCYLCGALGDRWLNQDGTENLDDGCGALALCSKHWDTRMGKSGGGRVQKSSAKPKNPRKIKPTQETML